MTYEQFVEKWKYELAGIALYGQMMNYSEVPISERTRHAMNVPKLVGEILRRMHADLCPAKADQAAVAASMNRMTPPATNGKPVPAAKA